MTASNGNNGTAALTTIDAVRGAILHLPGRPPFMLARDLAAAYGCEAKQITQAARRNPELFPEPDACFALAGTERARLLEAARLPKTATKAGQRGYTRLGANMLASFIRTRTAKERLLLIMRAFSALEEAAQADAPPPAGPGPREASLLRQLREHRTRLRVLERRMAAAEKRGEAVQRLERVVERAAGLDDAAVPAPAVPDGMIAVPVEEYIALLKARNTALEEQVQPKRRRFTPQERAEALRLAGEGRTSSEIGKALGRNASSVATVLADAERPRGKRP